MNPLIPMIAITGNPTSKNIWQMLESYKEVGIDAVMLYPRSGLEIEYMSEQWRMFCEDVLNSAKKLEMKVWLYDEFNWPSGSCKNAVAKEDPSYAAKRFVYRNGNVFVDVMKPGKAQMVAEPFDSDMLNPAAIRCFIRLTHEKYYQWFGQYFGNVIPGIFTDEPSFIYTSNEEGMYPYYEGVEEDYFAECGRDLKTDIIAYEEGKESPCFPGVFRTVIGKRFRECYIEPIARWCKEHNLMLTGHTLEDERPLTGTEMTGDWFQFIEKMDVPGIDETPTHLCEKDDMLFGMIENMRYNGKKAAMAELFALGPCSMSTARRRQFLWYAAAHGVNHFFIAISHMDGKGNIRKPDFFNNFNYYNFNFKATRFLAEEAEKAAAFSDKRVCAFVGVKCAYTTYLDALGKHTDKAVATKFATLTNVLTKKQIAWRMLREDEDNTCLYVLNLDGTTVVEERTGKRFEHLEELVKWLEQDGRGPYVTDRSGKLAENLRVKFYEDGTILVIDYENEPKGCREYILHTNKGSVEFSLESFGVQVFENGIISKNEEKEDRREVLVEDLRVVHRDNGVYRCVFLKNNLVEIEVMEPMKVRVYRREYQGGDAVVYLDGKALEFQNVCTELTPCFSKLYAGTEVQLTTGKHKIQTEMNDYAYLPVVLICGDFEAEGNTLKRTDTCTKTFLGTLKVAGRMQLPKDAKKVSMCMEDSQLYVTASVDGEEIGECAFAPYRFPVPSKYYGKEVEITFTFHTTLAPIFGDLKTLKEQGVFTPGWAEVPASKPEEVDIQKLRIRGISV